MQKQIYPALTNTYYRLFRSPCKTKKRRTAWSQTFDQTSVRPQSKVGQAWVGQGLTEEVKPRVWLNARFDQKYKGSNFLVKLNLSPNLDKTEVRPRLDRGLLSILSSCAVCVIQPFFRNKPQSSLWSNFGKSVKLRQT